MSVINRMLADLERRGAPGAGSAPAPGHDAERPSPRPWRARVQRALPAVLLIGLLAVGAALWRDRTPDVLAIMAESARAPTAAVDTDADPDSADPGVTHAAAADRDIDAPPKVTGLAFDRAEGAARLSIDFSRALAEPPGYSRSEDRLVLRLPAAWERPTLPAPPAGPGVFRSAALADARDGTTRLAFTVAADARFDLQHTGDRLVIVGRRPASRAGTSDPANGTDRAASQPERTAAAATAEPTSPQPTSPEPPPTESTTAAPDNPEPAPGGDTADEGAPGDEGEAAAARADAERQSAVAEVAAAGEEAAGSVRKSRPTLTPAERARKREAEARAALEAGNPDRARARLQAALAADPGRHGARDLLVRLELRSGRPEAARNLLANGLQRAPQRAGFAKPYARLLVDDGELERAMRVLGRADPAGERDAGYHGLRAAIAQRLGRHEQASRAYTRALAIDRGRGVWWLGLGISLAATDKPAAAVEAFRRARASGDLEPRLQEWAEQRIAALSRE